MARKRKKIDGEGDAPGGGLHPVVIVLGAYAIFVGPLAILEALDIPGSVVLAIGVAILGGILLLYLIFGWLSWCFPPDEPPPPPPSPKGRRKRRST